MPTDNPWNATRVSSLGAGRYSAVIGPQWDLAIAPQGGVLAAIAARTMASELGTEQPLRSFHGVFASPVPVGPVEVEVDVIRRGRSVSQLAASLHAPDAESGFRALAAFGNERPGFGYTELVMPDVPAPDECRSFRDPLPPEAGIPDGEPFPFWRDVLEGRPALGTPFWDPSPRDQAEVASWFRFEHPPLTDDDGQFDPLALLVAADMMPSAVFQRIDPIEERWFAPSVDLTVHLFDVPKGEWILNHNRAHHVGQGYASAECALWDPIGPTLCAWATQIMFFTKMP